MIYKVKHYNVQPIAGWRHRHFVGGHPALDLINTIAHRVDPKLAEDRLSDGEALRTWAISVGLMKQDEPNEQIEIGLIQEVLATVRKVRETAWALLNAVAEDLAPPHWALSDISAQASHDICAVRMLPNSGGQQLTIWGHASELHMLPGLLAWLALEALLVLPPARVRSCPRCGWLFYDTTRGGRRKWCSMSTCGNREKVTRHYRSIRKEE
jgi:predicted RNA-binding Zn ribbon-like protein